MSDSRVDQGERSFNLSGQGPSEARSVSPSTGGPPRDRGGRYRAGVFRRLLGLGGAGRGSQEGCTAGDRGPGRVPAHDAAASWRSSATCLQESFN